MAAVRPGVRLSIDVGSVRVGVARCDRDGLLAVPEVTLARDPDGESDIAEIAELVTRLGVVEVVVGLPLRLSGEAGPAAEAARSYAEAVARRVEPVPVRLLDERLTTVTASRRMRDAGRRQRAQRQVIDQAAAVVLLQTSLDTERATGRPPGEQIPVREQEAPGTKERE